MCGNIEYRTLQAVVNEAAENATETVVEVSAIAEEVAEELTIPANVELTIDGDLSNVTITNNGSLVIDGDSISDITSVTIAEGSTGTVTATVASEDGLANMVTADIVDTVELTKDVSVTNADTLSLDGSTVAASIAEEGEETETTSATLEAVIDLGGNTLSYSATTTIAVNNVNYTVCDSISVTNNAKLTIKNGKFVNSTEQNLQQVTTADIAASAGASVTIENVEVSTTGTFLYPRNDTTEVTVSKSTINAGAYGIGTNAGDAKNYGVKINVYDSNITATNEWGGTGIIINVGGKLTISGSTISGNMQGVIVRAGTAEITNSTIVCDGSYYTNNVDEINKYLNGNWGSGNAVPMAALVVGNYTKNAYLADASVGLNNVTLTVSSNNDYVPQLFMASGANSYSSSITGVSTDTIYGALVASGYNSTINGNSLTSTSSFTTVSTLGQ